jgi:hypothetical protein
VGTTLAMNAFPRRRRVADDAPGGRAAAAARRGAWTLARIVTLITWLVVAVIVAGILLIVFDANAGNQIVKAIHDAARFLVGPFKDMFSLSSRKGTIALNWGIAAAIYLIVGSLIARLLRR